MPGKIKVRILAGRNLPVMDRSGDTTDAYVEIKFSNTTYKTDVCRKSLNPQWNSEWYRFEVDDAELQDEPLQIRLMDHDTYSANDAIGKVYLDLNPLLLPGVPPPVKNIWTLEATMNSSIGSQGGSVMTGWIPVYDTMHGIRGEVNIIVKVELFSDFNKFRQSSCGVQFFCSPNIPYGYHAQVIHGFVEELIVSDDPEYKWIDKIRTPRASNEARQTLFFKLSGEVQRKIGLKALDLGGNAVIGYLQNFDLEGESGIVVRGIGTAVTLVKLHDISNMPNDTVEELTLLGLPSKAELEGLESDDSVPLLSSSPSHSPVSSSVNLAVTQVSSKFPGYGKLLPKHSRHIMRVTQYRSPGFNKDKTRQMSLQSNILYSKKDRSNGSTLSLSDDVIDDTSVRSMLALEDMRGEPTGNRFSRGLKNLRYLPQNVLSKKMTQIKVKISDSFDEESDLDSTYSSTWSIGGSDSAKSSIMDLHPSGKKKKLTHKRSTGEGIASLLIRSIHSGLPLDSVREDRETPTPSPVNFMVDPGEFVESQKKHRTISENDNEHEIGAESIQQHDSKLILDGRIHVVDSKPDLKYDDGHLIPMISSSETDTSTSDDEPSESSTNYNILDDSSSVIDPGSPIMEKYGLNFQKHSVALTQNTSAVTSDYPLYRDQKDFEDVNTDASIQGKFSSEVSAGTSTDVTSSSADSDIVYHGINCLEESELLLHKKTEESGSFITENKDNVIDTIQATNIASAILLAQKEFSINATSNLNSNTLSSSSNTIEEKTEVLETQKSIHVLDDSVPLAMSTPTESNAENNAFFPEGNPYSSTNFQRSISLNEQEINIFKSPSISSSKSEFESSEADEDNKTAVHLDPQFNKSASYSEPSGSSTPIIDATSAKDKEYKNTSVLSSELNEEGGMSNITDSMNDDNHSVRSETPPTPLLLVRPTSLVVDDNKNLEIHGRKEKSPKRVERTDTVIYKGPSREKEKPIMPVANRDITGKIVSAPPVTSTSTKSVPHIVIPSVETTNCHLQVPVTDIHMKSAYTEITTPPIFIASLSNSVQSPLNDPRITDILKQKFRRHCMLDLIRTIDTKMLVQPSHHEKKDSIRSRRKRREKLNIPPSPESIHKTRSHRRRSKSKSPDKTSHSHISNSQSYSNTTSALAAPANISSSKHVSAFNNDSHPIESIVAVEPNCNKSVNHNVSEDNESSIKKVYNDFYTSHSKDNMSSKNALEDNEAHETAVQVLAVKKDIPYNNNVNLELRDLELRNTNGVSLLEPKKHEMAVYKSQSAYSLREVRGDANEITKTTNAANHTDNLCVPCLPPFPRQPDEVSSSPANPLSAIPSAVVTKLSNSPVTKTNMAVPMHRRSSDSDLSITPKGFYKFFRKRSDRSMGGYLRPSTAVIRTMNQDALEMLEYPFITMQQYPSGFILHIAGLVSARSVKLLERISNLEEPEGRDSWWTEIRMEVRSHARALACNVVIGYKEETSICDDVCVLSASGTAAVINLHSSTQDQDNAMINRVQQGLMTTSMDLDRDKVQQKVINLKNEKTDEIPAHSQQINSMHGKAKRPSESNENEIPHILNQNGCNLCHLPYNEASVPFRVDMSKCAVCRRAKVPDVLFTTIELPENIPITGRGCFIQSTVCKSKRDLRGELNAKEISDCLPFLEYELHSLLLNKLKVKGMNAIFGLKVQVSIGERLVVGMAVGTAVYLTPLPIPSVPQIASGNSWHNEEQLAEIQKKLVETMKMNREFYQLKSIADIENAKPITTSDTDDSDDELPDLDLGTGSKDACVLEVDDVEDMDRISLLMDERPPVDFHVVNTQTIPGLEDLEIVRNLQMFTQVSRAKIPAGQFASMPSKYFARLLQTVYFKLRRMVPCALCDLQFKIALPEQDEIQLSVVGMALGLGEPTKMNKFKRKPVTHSASKDQVKRLDDSDMIFSLDEDHSESAASGSDATQSTSTTFPSISSTLTTATSAQKSRPRSPLRTKSYMVHKHKHVPLKERYGVDITPLSYLPGGKIERYLGNLNFFFIRESTSIRENGGLSGFTHSFVTEVLAIVRAHITALGGNAMVAYFMTQCVLLHSPHKNQGQCLINVGGDVVSVSYFGNERHLGNSNC
ncbi:uncharacterized protein LOC107274679 isoform X2 [Cephus cinctus]|uniref:Uncharacterized protein LOC107274679 isoform X2 n=1 Tax=Cephus cinctus TaxID=211228 RepID=A0AAJ7W7T0_CEPCN|nr:uncharacterized protein LOC107274679 isoform X2 [Cephus cinctus]